ncbi:MAG: dTDP-4-dehydrorhamnose 3,5-epimerase family protein [Verrucomicrobiaceae bacterium]
MKFTPTPIQGVVIVDLEPVRDERGFFTRSFFAREFTAAGLHTEFVKTNIAFSHRAGTLRGMTGIRAIARPSA